MPYLAREPKAFAEGGNTAEAAPGAMPTPALDLQQVINSLNQLNSNFVELATCVDQWQSELHVNYSAGAAEEAMAVIKEMQQFCNRTHKTKKHLQSV
ncbi:hypothetical protein C1N53_02520 [Pontibacter sp. SGAir0037]|nr:hypothetical protein C1N53_02520 [Pontibacter sp. SGAir0037]